MSSTRLGQRARCLFVSVDEVVKGRIVIAAAAIVVVIVAAENKSRKSRVL